MSRISRMADNPRWRPSFNADVALMMPATGSMMSALVMNKIK